MNTVKKGAAYEAAFRAQYPPDVLWQPPKPRAHSTGFDAMSWRPGGWAILWEFKSGRMSCAKAEALSNALWERRPVGVGTRVIHRTREREFCEH